MTLVGFQDGKQERERESVYWCVECNVVTYQLVINFKRKQNKTPCDLQFPFGQI